MVPDDVNVSAFAAYSGKVKKSISRNQKRRLKSKVLRKNAINLEGKNILNTKKLKRKKNQDLVPDGALSPRESKSELLLPSLINMGITDTKLPLNGKRNKKLKKKKTSEMGFNEPNKEERQINNSINEDGTEGINDTSFQNNGKETSPVSLSLEINDKDMYVDTRKPKKLKKVKSKISKTVSSEKVEAEQQLSSSPGMDNISDEEPPLKLKKKVCIANQKNIGDSMRLPLKIKKRVHIPSPEENTRSDLKLKKPIVCTPRFTNKKKVIKECGSERQQFDTSKSNILQKVDKYLKDKKKLELRLSKIGSPGTPKGHKPVKDIELAQLAKYEMQMKSSEVIGKYSFEKILEPVSVDSFISEHWEKSPLHIPGQNPKKFSTLISTEEIDGVLRERIVNFGKHLDVTSYSGGQRETHNLEGRANAHVVWDFYSNGCSVRLLNPQFFFQRIHSLNAILQEYFGCFVGANSYLTPPMSQGFAPHYDDIEAFILQIEGSKIWKLYEPMDSNGYLPRHSSRNLLEEEIGEPILEVKLNPGDLLYFPRGYIHQGRTEEQHSLHLTLSVYQKTAWCDLLEKLLPLTLKKAASQDVEFRKGLPIGYLKSAGLVHKNTPPRKELVRKIKKLITRLNDFIETDTAVDQMGLSFIHDALPPILNVSEAACTVVGDGWKMRSNGQLQGQVIITLETNIRWIKAFCYRILEEEVTLENGVIDKQIRIYYTIENSKEYHAEEPQYLIVDYNMLPSLCHLTSVYPNFTKVSELPFHDEDGKILLVSDLWDRGLLMTDVPLELFNDKKSVNENEQTLTAEELDILSDLIEKVPKDNENESLPSSSEYEEEESSDVESVESSDVMILTDEENFTEGDFV